MTIFSNPGLPRVLNRVTPGRLEATLTLLKERRKKIRNLGSYFQHYNDRVHWYNAMGGLTGTKFILEKHHTRAQFVHPNFSSDRYDIRTIKMKGSQFDGFGNHTRSTWDQQLASTNLFASAFRKDLSVMDQDVAIEMLEQWGVKYVLLDDVRKPSVQDSHYIKHKLYVDKFPWIRDPTTNHHVGDPDWWWRGAERPDYAAYGANSSGSKNAFQSLWRSAAVASTAGTKAAVDAAASSREKKAATQ